MSKIYSIIVHRKNKFLVWHFNGGSIKILPLESMR